ncbi:MAG: ATP-binding protein [Acidimicrobiales bacterium]
MPGAPVQVTFAVQFATFVVAAGGFALVLLRAQYLGRRRRDEVALAVGFAAIAVVAFLHGALIHTEVVASTAVQALGLALLALGGVFGGKLRPGVVALGTRSSKAPGEASAAASTVLLCVGIVCQAASLGIQAAAPLVSAGLLAAGAIAIGAALVLSSRRSIAGRVAASAGFTLLALVLVLSVALSAVLSSTVQNEAIKGLDTQAAAEVTQVGTLTRDDLPQEAYLLSTAVESYLKVCTQAVDACISNDLLTVARYLPSVPSVAALWVRTGRATPGAPQVLATSPNTTALLGATTGGAVASSGVVTQAISKGRVVSSVEVTDGRLLAVAASPDEVTSGAPGARVTVVGVAVVVAPLNDAYLQIPFQADKSVSLALLGSRGVLGSAGQLPGKAPLIKLASSTLSRGASVHGSIGAQFVTVLPIQDTLGDPVAALVAATSTHAVELSQDSLFRTLFLIALGGTLLALLLASAIGERIGARLRRLTVAADAIRGGRRGVRAGVDTGDEVGELGAAFDSMATSIDEKTSALRQAADDEAALRGRLEAVVAGMGEALLAVDGSGRITDFNEAAEELIGVNATAVLGEPVDEVIVLLDTDGRDISAELRRPPGLRWSVDAMVLRRGASGPAQVPVAVSAGDVRGSGDQGGGVVFVIRDLRSEREVEQMKSEFLSRVGHELRTPLTGIMGFSELLARAEVSPDRAATWHKEILEQSKRLLRTVEMLEFFASAGAGRVFLRKEPLDPGALVDEVAEAWSTRVNGSRRVLRRVPRDLPSLSGDRRWLALALDELVDNAVKFSPDGAQVTVTAQAAPDRRSVELSVSDQGRGMSKAEAAQAFTDFVQGDSSDTRLYGGLGLGLSLVQQVAEGHGGSVTCDSTPGSGSRFAIVIPVAVDAEPSPNVV